MQHFVTKSEILDLVRRATPQACRLEEGRRLEAEETRNPAQVGVSIGNTTVAAGGGQGPGGK